jgi:hypothetical protein
MPPTSIAILRNELMRDGLMRSRLFSSWAADSSAPVGG